MAFTIVKRNSKKLVIKVGNKLYTSKGVRKSSRIVYLFDKFVVKFGDQDCTSQQNQLEVDLWQTLSLSHKKYFAKLIDWCYGESEKSEEIIAVRQELINVSNRTTASRWHQRVYDDLEQHYGLADIEVSEHCLSNAAITTTGRLKIYDYGIHDGYKWD